MLHVLNGDAAAAALDRTDIPGERLVWRDITVEGPATPVCLPVPAERAAWLTATFGLDPDAYVAAVEAQTRRLAGARAHDEVVLWFEQDLFCAVTLWALLDWLARARPSAVVSLVYPALDDEMRGLGALTGDRLGALFAERRPLGEDAVALGARAWAAYASPDPFASAPLLREESDALPFVGNAFRCHLGRFPSLFNGLNEVERAILAALRDGALPFRALFRAVTRQPALRRHGMGDRQLAGHLRRLEPLVTITGATVMTAELDLTPQALGVAAGTLDWLGLHAIDTWLGGVHLVAGAPVWRFDDEHNRLLPAGSEGPGDTPRAYNS